MLCGLMQLAIFAGVIYLNESMKAGTGQGGYSDIDEVASVCVTHTTTMCISIETERRSETGSSGVPCSGRRTRLH